MSYPAYNYETWLSEEAVQRCWAVANDELPQDAVTLKEMEEFLNLIEHVVENRTIH